VLGILNTLFATPPSRSLKHVAGVDLRVVCPSRVTVEMFGSPAAVS
jgi:hypothetical protein